MQEVTRTVLVADEGMILTDGKNYGRTVYLSVGASASEWYEITEEEYERMSKKLEDQMMHNIEGI
jgi:hypothetical protein